MQDACHIFDLFNIFFKYSVLLMPFLGLKNYEPDTAKGKRVLTSVFNKDPYGAPLYQGVLHQNAHAR